MKAETHTDKHTQTSAHRNTPTHTQKEAHMETQAAIHTHTHPYRPTAASQINLSGKERNWMYWTPTLCQTSCRNFKSSFNLHKATLKSEVIIPTFTDKNKDAQRWTAQAHPVISRKETPTSYGSDAATFPSPSRAFLYIVGHRNYCQLIFHLMVLPSQLLTPSGFLRHTHTLFCLGMCTTMQLHINSGLCII